MPSEHEYGPAKPHGSDSLQRVSARLMSTHKLPLPGMAVLVVLVICLWPDAWAGRQMLLHIVMMTILAPALAYAMGGLLPRRDSVNARWLWSATALQALVFLFWHTPYGMMLGMHSSPGELFLQGSLLLTACLFWWSVLHINAGKTWHAILALLVTGKVFCLVALLLTFAPRALYPAMSLADQQFAGLIMITLCPLCYVVCAICLCWQWLTGVEKETEQHDKGLLRRQACG